MKHKDMAVAMIAKEGAAEFSNISRCLYPALCFRIKFPKFLQLPILLFIQKLDTHVGCDIVGKLADAHRNRELTALSITTPPQ